MADCDRTAARKGKTMTKHMTGDSEVESKLRKVKTAAALTERAMTDFMRDEPSDAFRAMVRNRLSFVAKSPVHSLTLAVHFPWSILTD